MQKNTIKQNFDRFKDAEWFDPNLRVIVGGLGNIGSYLTFFLSRLGYTIVGYDDDTVDAVNLGGQLYGYSSLGKKKTKAIAKTLEEYSLTKQTKFINKTERFKNTSDPAPYMFSCFDSMQSRNVMFYNWLSVAEKNAVKKPIFIDGRTTAETGIIFCVTLDNMHKYPDTLELDKVLPDLQCSLKATSHNGGMIGSLMVACFVNHIYNLKMKENIREVPFKVTYELPTLTFGE